MVLIEGSDSGSLTRKILVDSSGRQIVTPIGAYTHVHKHVALTTTNETTIWDPTSGTKFVLTDLILNASANGSCTLRDGTAGTTIFQIGLLANVPFSHSFVTAHESTTADNNFTAQASATNQYVSVCGYEI